MKGVVFSAESRGRRASPISRQFQSCWCPQKFLLPVGKLCVENFPNKPSALPNCEISILNRQLWQGRLIISAKGVIQHRHLTDKDAERPRIKHYMVHCKNKDMFLLVKLKELGSQ